MPLRLEAPKAGRTPYYRVRGKYLGITVDRSAETPEKRAAETIKRRWEREIERGEYQDPRAKPEPVVEKPTFLAAAVAYMRAGGERTFLNPIIEMTGQYALNDRLITDIDQIAVDNAAGVLFPNVSGATQNRQFYTPVIAVLRRAGIARLFQRPKGANGNRSTSWMEPEQAFALIIEASKIDPEFGLLCLTLCYTGMRISEALNARLKDLHLDRAELQVPMTKNGEPRLVHLPPVVMQALRTQPARRVHTPARGGFGFAKGEGGTGPRDGGVPFLERHPESKLFRFHAGGALRTMLSGAMKNANLSFPRRQGGFHLMRHTWASWMRKFGGLDTSGLVSTGVWKDRGSAARYEHLNVSDEARRADTLPVPPRTLKSV